MLTFALLLTPPAYSQACTPTEDTAPWPGRRGHYQFTHITHTGQHSHALSHEYKHTRVQANKPLPMTPFSCSGAEDLLAHSSEPTQEPWGREAVPVSC